jgi:hypothetical protein
MDILVLLMLIIGIIFVSISWFKNELHCPPPRIIYKYVPANVIDTQFSKENLPSNIYNDMFNSDNIWVGGMSISMGKTAGMSIPKNQSTPIPLQNASSLTKSVPFMSMTPKPTLSYSSTGPITA